MIAKLRYCFNSIISVSVLFMPGRSKSQSIFPAPRLSLSPGCETLNWAYSVTPGEWFYVSLKIKASNELGLGAFTIYVESQIEGKKEGEGAGVAEGTSRQQSSQFSMRESQKRGSGSSCIVNAPLLSLLLMIPVTNFLSKISELLNLHLLPP